MIKIFLDDKEINEDYYAEIKKSAEAVGSAFTFGRTICEQYMIKLSKEEITEIPNKVYIKENGEILKTLYVDNYLEDDYLITLNLVDKMIDFNFPYDASTVIGETGATLKRIFDDICNKAGVSTEIAEFNSQDMIVTWYDNSYSARDYLGFIGELNGWLFYIDREDTLNYIDLSSITPVAIDIGELGRVKYGQKHKFTRVVFDDSNNKWESGNDSGDTYYINTSNVFLTSQSQVDELYNKINGFEFYDIKIDNMNFTGLECGNIISVNDNDVLYPTILQFNGVNYAGGQWFGNLNIEVKTDKQAETEIIGVQRKIKSLKTIVDRDNNEITRIAQKVETVEGNIGEISQSVEEKINESSLKINAIQSTIIGGVEKVKNSLVTIDSDGFNLSTETSQISAQITNNKFSIEDRNGPLAFIGYDENDKTSKAEMDNLTVDKYFVAGYHRTEKFEPNYEKRTGVFYIGD